MRDASCEAGGEIPRYEWVAVATLLVLGIGFRLAFPDRMAVEHFDEGVYATNIWFDSTVGYEYPKRRFYAPPLLPALIEWSIIIEHLTTAPAGAPVTPSNLATMAPSLLAGCLTLVAIWWTARTWFSPPAGLAALALATFSDFHALYSRAALSEALLVLFLILSLHAIRQALAGKNFVYVFAAGLLTGLAWWTKYNGWLPLAIGFAAVGLGVVLDQQQRARVGTSALRWIGIVCIACAVWSPFLWSIQRLGGYAAIAANHKQYMVGINGWLASCWQQYANLLRLDGLATCVGVAVAVIVAALATRSASGGSLLKRSPWACVAAALVSASIAAWVGSFAVLFALSLVFLGAEYRWLRGSSGQKDMPRTFSWQLAAVWVIGLFLVTPLYHPYPRLALPWICGLCATGAAGVNKLLRMNFFRASDVSRSNHWPVIVSVVAVALVVLSTVLGPRSVRPATWESRASWTPVAAQVVTDITRETKTVVNDPSRAIVFVFGEPALFHHLSATGPQAFMPAEDMSFIDKGEQPVPVFLVSGPHAARTPKFAEEYSRCQKHLRLIGEYDYLPSTLVLLNQYDPRQVDEAAIVQKVKLYLIVHDH